ncbi:hypothetical protein GZL_09267 [Streptomyces sp. 769]|nr:hypothetical protein GZL_09267 [Streptomyces sp. 769]
MPHGQCRLPTRHRPSQLTPARTIRQWLPSFRLAAP